jgi:hypothetical protein
MERERGTGHETPAVETSRNMQRRRTTHGRSWRESHKTEKAGENKLAAYVPVKGDRQKKTNIDPHGLK